MLTPEQRLAAPWTHPIHFLAFGFGSGLAPKAPGTFGSLATIPLIVLLANLPLAGYIAVTLLAALVGIWICQFTARALGVHDHGAIVWDEVAGMLVVFIAVPLTWDTLLLGFVLFRWFDITKPLFIGWLDRNCHDGLGIMADDIAAGALSLLLLHGYVYLVY